MSRSYLAGFFDGEGSVGAYGSPPVARLQTVQVRRDILDILQAETGLGRVITRSYAHCWAIGHRDEVIAFGRIVLPYLRVKRDEMILAIELAGLTTNGGRPPAGVKLRAYDVKMARRQELAVLLRKREAAG